MQHSVCDFFNRTTYTGDRSPGISSTEILWPGQRRGARPCRWPRSGCWGRLRCSCRRCGCGRAGSGRRRWSAPAHRGENIDPTPAIHIIWRTRSAALSRSDVYSRVIQGIAARGNLVPQARNSRPQQGYCARHVRRGHRCAAEICI